MKAGYIKCFYSFGNKTFYVTWTDVVLAFDYVTAKNEESS